MAHQSANRRRISAHCYEYSPLITWKSGKSQGKCFWFISQGKVVEIHENFSKSGKSQGKMIFLKMLMLFPCIFQRIFYQCYFFPILLTNWNQENKQ